MKLLLALSCCLTAFQGVSQSVISGSFPNYPNSALRIFGFNGIHDQKLGSVKTDARGRFILRTPYWGAVRFGIAGRSIELLKDSTSDLRFSLTAMDSLKIRQGESAHLYVDYFYSAVEEQSSSAEKNIADFKDKLQAAKGYASYYIPLRQDLDSLSQARRSTDLDVLRAVYIDHLARDGEELESSGLVKSLILAYLQSVKMQYGKAYTGKREVDAAMGLLDKVDIETPRGQQLASFLMGWLKSRGNEAGRDSIVGRIACLSCEMDETLKRKIQAFKAFKIGAQAPNIVFSSVARGARSLYDVRSKYKLIIFWASWCGHCQLVMPIIEKDYPELKKNGVEVVSVSADVDPAAYVKARENLPWPYDYVDYKKWDSNPFLDYDVTATPTFVLLNAKNVVLDASSDFDKITKDIGQWHSQVHL
ncbi:MAG: TlpA disulfide reductase family protein [Flavobacteriales bacterium]